MHFVKCKFLLILYLGGCEFDLFGMVKVIFAVKNYDLFRIFSFLFYHVVNLLALATNLGSVLLWPLVTSIWNFCAIP